MDWKLTDEEIGKEMGMTGGLTTSVIRARFVAQAQAKKLVECLETVLALAPRNKRLPTMERFLYVLKKEVGL